MIGVGTFTVTDKMRALVDAVLTTGRISYGPMSRTLEAAFSAMHGCRFGVLSNSGTSSLQVALQALKELRGWPDGAEVLVPSVTFVATANVVLHCGMTPVLVDVEPALYGMDPALAEKAVTSRTVAMIPVHLFGMPCDLWRLSLVAARHSLATIEDSCETMLARHCGHWCGSWGDVGCFSFYVAHLLTAGVGGIATTNDPDLAAAMRSLVNHGRDGIYISIDDDDGAKGDRLKEIISKRFRFERIGHSYRITELEAALALAQLDDLPAIIQKRRANAAYLTEALDGLGDVLQLPTVRFGTEHSYMMYPIVIKGEGKEGLTGYLEERGVETRDMLPLTNQPCYAGMWDPADYPVAEWINNHGFYVGCHQDMSEGDLAHIARTIREYWDGA